MFNFTAAGPHHADDRDAGRHRRRQHHLGRRRLLVRRRTATCRAWTRRRDGQGTEGRCRVRRRRPRRTTWPWATRTAPAKGVAPYDVNSDCSAPTARGAAMRRTPATGRRRTRTRAGDMPTASTAGPVTATSRHAHHRAERVAAQLGQRSGSSPAPARMTTAVTRGRGQHRRPRSTDTGRHTDWGTGDHHWGELTQVDTAGSTRRHSRDDLDRWQRRPLHRRAARGCIRHLSAQC